MALGQVTRGSRGALVFKPRDAKTLGQGLPQSSCTKWSTVIGKDYFELQNSSQSVEKKRSYSCLRGFSVFSLLLHMFKFINLKGIQPFHEACNWPHFTFPSPLPNMGKQKEGEVLKFCSQITSLVVFYGAWFLRTWHVFIKHDVPLPLYTFFKKKKK